MKKITFDTNILLHNVDLIIDPQFEGYNKVSIIPVISELDNIKINSGRADLKYKGRKATRTLKGLIDDKIITPLVTEEVDELVSLSKYYVMDDLIISICKKHDIRLITMDYNVYLKAMHLGVETELHEGMSKFVNLSTIYKGRKDDIYVSKDTIDKVYKKGSINASDVSDIHDFLPNETVVLVDYSNPKSMQYMRYIGGKLYKLSYKEKASFYGITARSVEQKVALGLLNDDSLRIVTMTGEAGSSKSILAFAVGLEKSSNEGYKLHIAKPPVSLSKSLQQGFKKGTLIEKAIESLGSFTTNLERMAEAKGDRKTVSGKKILIDMLETEKLNYLSIEDCLGMSFGDNDLIILDEAELLSKNDMKALITRGGRWIIIGDCEQNSELSNVDYDNSGLLHLIDIGKKSERIAHITLTECHRSEMVKEINEIW
ncbi:MAG: PhoH family protein [Cetobacterium sp.]